MMHRILVLLPDSNLSSLYMEASEDSQLRAGRIGLKFLVYLENRFYVFNDAMHRILVLLPDSNLSSLYMEASEDSQLRAGRIGLKFLVYLENRFYVFDDAMHIILLCFSSKGRDMVEIVSVFILLLLLLHKLPVAPIAPLSSKIQSAAPSPVRSSMGKRDNWRRVKQLNAEKANSVAHFEALCDWILRNGDNPRLHTGGRARAHINPAPTGENSNSDHKREVNAIGGKYCVLMGVPEDISFLDEFLLGRRNRSNVPPVLLH